MVKWYDYFALAITIALAATVIYGVIAIGRAFSRGIQSTKESLKNRGVNVSDKGLSLKTKTRMVDREEYMDATQRGLVKALSSSQYGPTSGERRNALHDPVLPSSKSANGQSERSRQKHRENSPSTSIRSANSDNGEEKKRSLLNRFRGRVH